MVVGGHIVSIEGGRVSDGRSDHPHGRYRHNGKRERAKILGWRAQEVSCGHDQSHLTQNPSLYRVWDWQNSNALIFLYMVEKIKKSASYGGRSRLYFTSMLRIIALFERYNSPSL